MDALWFWFIKPFAEFLAGLAVIFGVFGIMIVILSLILVYESLFGEDEKDKK